MRSLRWRLVLIYVALVFVVMIISGTFIIIRIGTTERNKVREQLEQQADIIYSFVMSGNTEPDFGTVLNQLTTDIQASILSDTGIMLATNAHHGDDPPNYNNTAVVYAIAGDERFDSGRWADSIGLWKDWINFARPYYAGEKKYIVYMQKDIAEITAKTARETSGFP